MKNISRVTAEGQGSRRLFPRISQRVLRDNIDGWLFIAPIVISALIFTVYPIFRSLDLSFRDWNPLGQDTFIGLENYRLLFQDKVFGIAMKNVLLYALYTIPAGLVWGIAVAMALQNIKWRGFFRGLYFLPTITSSVAISVVWTLILQPDFGLLNSVLDSFGIIGPNWLGSTKTAMISVSAIVVWLGTGYWMIVFLAGLLDIPADYMDAARVDGASGWQVFRYITIPHLTPTIFYYITNALITVWVAFDIVYVMTSGGPANSTMMPAVYLYNQAWTQLNMGYASAISWAMAVVIFAFTALNFWLSRKWVNYDR